jgi:hypothetical protein
MIDQPDSRRRSERVVSRLPIRVEADHGALAEGMTAVVNGHGALVLCDLDAKGGDAVTLTNLQSRESVRCRVVWAGGADAASGLQKYGLELVEERKHFWGFEIPEA